MTLYIVHSAGKEHLRQIGAVQSAILDAADAPAALAAAMALSGAHLTITAEWVATDLSQYVAAKGPVLVEGHPLISRPARGS